MDRSIVVLVLSLLLSSCSSSSSDSNSTKYKETEVTIENGVFLRSVSLCSTVSKEHAQSQCPFWIEVKKQELGSHLLQEPICYAIDNDDIAGCPWVGTGQALYRRDARLPAT